MAGCSRRDFVKGAAALGAGAAMAGGMPVDAFAKEDGPLVVEAVGKDDAKLARAVLDALGGMAMFVKPGDTVVVKPNIGWDREPQYAGNTSPGLVREVVRMCLDAGAKKVKVFDRTCNDPRRCYTNSGIEPYLEGLKDKRVEVSHIDDRRFRDVKIKDGMSLKAWSFYEDVLDADRYINMPVAKHHGLAALTLGMKNIMGIVGDNRAQLHREIHECLVDLNRIVKSDLTVIDATRILVANGPQGGDLADVRETNTVIASTDVVAADSVATGLFGLTAADIPHIKLGQAQGLGVCDLDRIQIKKVEV
jgi:uncharacterized protein (DUF362 family)